MNFLLLVLLISGMTVAVFRDLKTSKIPNLLTFPMMLLGLAWHGGMNGLNGLWFSCGGLLLGIGIFLIPHIMGGMGAGDVKLLGAAGAILGPKGVVFAAAFSVLLGGVYAIVLLAIHHEYAISFLQRLWTTMKSLFLTGQLILFPPGKDEKQPKLKFALPIAFGTIGYVFLKYSGSHLIQDLLGIQFSI